MQTPARRERERLKGDAQMRRVNEVRYTEFRMACDAGEATACNSLGEWWSVMRGQYDKAATVFARACIDMGQPQSCMNLGILYASGRGLRKSAPKAVAFWDRACEAGNGDSCEMAGREYLRGVSVPAQPARGAAFLAKACEQLGHGKACNALAEVLLVGKYGQARDAVKARYLLDRACQQHEISACRNLSVMYRRGDGVAVDVDQANAYFRQAVELTEAQTGKKVYLGGTASSGGSGGAGVGGDGREAAGE